MTYSKDFRQKVAEVYHEKGLSHRSAANLFGIGTRTVTRWLNGFIPKNTRNVKPRKINDKALQEDVLPKLPPKSVLVMDNTSFHKRNDIKEIIQKAGHQLEYLPVYSPDLNPIEKKWAQCKAIKSY